MAEDDQRGVLITTHNDQPTLIAGQGSFLERISMSGLSAIEFDTMLPAELPKVIKDGAKVGEPKAGGRISL